MKEEAELRKNEIKSVINMKEKRSDLVTMDKEEFKRLVMCTMQTRAPMFMFFISILYFRSHYFSQVVYFNYRRMFTTSALILIVEF